MTTKQILSPLPGTFYRRPAPDKPTYKEPGDAVVEGDALGLVEVMKTFYEVKSDAGGRWSNSLWTMRRRSRPASPWSRSRCEDRLHLCAFPSARI
jgi:acetyl-CoA carboxylase biotin carboxyl carrier protein